MIVAACRQNVTFLNPTRIIFGAGQLAAQTLAVVLSAILTVRREQKRAKLLQYAGRVWNIMEGSEDERITAAITATSQVSRQVYELAV